MNLQVELKHTFYVQESQKFDKDALVSEASSITGIGIERMHQLYSGEVKMTSDEYDKIGRCPARMVPKTTLEAALLEVKSNFTQKCENVGCDKVKWGEMRANGWNDVEDDGILQKPDKIMKNFTRIRVRRLLQSLDRHGWFPELEDVAMKCYNSNFTTLRFINTVAAWLAGTKLMREELGYLLDNGGYAMNAKEWISATKAHHAMVKVMRVCITREDQITSEEMAELLYFPSLAARDHYVDEQVTLKQIASRTAPKDPYVGLDGNAETLREFFIQRWSTLMRDTEKVKAPATWSEFIKRLYLKLPSGSCGRKGLGKVDFNDIGGIRGLIDKVNGEIRMNKRFRAEIKPIRHFKLFGKWMVSAFLKYEVAKNRWLYPAEFEYIVLGLYMMDSIIDAFLAVSGVDLGHTLQGGVAVKLDVVREVKNDSFCVNSDGAAFDENHSKYDMTTIYLMMKETVQIEGANSLAYQETMEAFDKYVESIGARDVRFPKLKGVTRERTVEILHTLFSGEPTTSAVNTAEVGGNAMYATHKMAERELLDWAKLFYKGDDLNSFMSNWLSAFIMLKWIERCGVKLEPAKDHIEKGQCEHERCIVTSKGYNGSICRRLGSMVAAEPQGALVLTLAEMLTSTSVNVMSLIARGVHYKVAWLMFDATICTYMNVNSLPKSFVKQLGISKANGGIGLWYDGTWYCNTHKGPPEVVTEFVIKEGGPLAEFGKAHMTDNMMEVIMEEHGVEYERLKIERDKMVGDSAMVGLGPTKYGTRRWRNIEVVLKRAREIRQKPMREVNLNSAAKAVAYLAAAELSELMLDPTRMRYVSFRTPRQVILDSISKSGMLNEAIAMIVLKVESKSALHNKLLAYPSEESDVIMVKNLHLKGQETIDIFCSGELDVVFWSFREKMSTEVSALVQRWATRAVAAANPTIGLDLRKRLSGRLYWEIVVSEVARIIWEYNKKALKEIIF
jgi:hypothetical protein